ncbi:MAG: dethiobiotin synthase [Mariprofundaceae bacterium]|nr:dethiobiotin synthase [Mariprofundaceae bacterium]
MGRKIFVTATDTGAGKTYLTSRLVDSLLRQKQHALAIKPVACGTEGRINEDVTALMRAQNISSPERINLYSFAMPAAPCLAAAEEGKTIDPATLINWCSTRSSEADICLIEGVGGVMVPLNGRYLVSNWLADLKDCEVMLVIGARLGCINHALLTLQQLVSMKCFPDYIVINATDQSSPPEQARRALEPCLPEGIPLHISSNPGDGAEIEAITRAILARD